MMTNEKKLKFEKGLVCQMKWGATMALVNFYEVTRTTSKTVWFKRIPDVIHTHDGYGQAGTKLPDLTTNKRGGEFRKQIRGNEIKGQYAYINYQGIIEPWTGQPITFDTYD